MNIKITDIYLSEELGSIRRTNNNSSTDVIVLIKKKEHDIIEKHVATFFTYDSISSLKTKHFNTGDYLKGKYFFIKNMVLIDECSKKSICEVINNLIDEGDFNEAFNKI